MRHLTLPTLLAVAAAVAGCGEEPTRPDFVIGAQAAWSWNPASVDEVGYTVALLLVQRQLDSRCRDAPDSTRLTVNGVAVPLTRDPDSHCAEGRLILGPSLRVEPITARVEDGKDNLVGEVVFDGLAPGTAATLASPADGRVRAGDEVVVVPPSTLPTSQPSRAMFFLLEGPSVNPGLYVPALPERLLDGVHVVAPAFTGPAAVVFTGMPHAPPADLSCPGFFACTAMTDDTVGPIQVVGEP
jgi:hypothetical protein